MPELPSNLQTLEAWTPEEAQKHARSGKKVVFWGPAKTGKTESAFTSDGPLYIVYLDPNATLDSVLLRRQEKVNAGILENSEVRFPIGPRTFPSIDPRLLKAPEAQRRLTIIDDYARWARQQALEDVAAGKPAGTFILDGLMVYKGLQEKALFNFSATFGDRAVAGQHCTVHGPGCDVDKTDCIRVPQPRDYGSVNGRLRALFANFNDGPLDVVATVEARGLYAKDGKGQDVRVGDKAGLPEQVTYPIHALVKCSLTAQVTAKGKTFTPMYTIDWIGEPGRLDMFGRQMLASGWKGLRKELVSKLPEGETQLQPAGSLEEVVLVQPNA